MKYRHTKEELEDVVKKSLSIAQVCRELNIRAKGGNYRTIKNKLSLFNIDTSHFTGQGWNSGIHYRAINKKKPLEEILVENSTFTSTHSLRQRLIKEGIKEHKCERCDNTEWLGEKIKLELNHKNGINTDHRLCNLEILCPNCHSLTPNYRGKNKVSALSERKEVEYRKFREGSNDANPEPSPKKREGAETLHGIPKSKEKICVGCKEQFITNRNQKFCSVSCYKESTKWNIPKVPEIIEAFEKYNSFLQVGKHFNVSDNAVRKWCNTYGIMDMVKRKSRPQTSKDF